VANITIVFGVLLIVQGLGFFFHSNAPTALIPAYFGAALLILGVVAHKESLRKHAMHLASLLGLIGFLLPAGRLISKLIADGEIKDPEAAAALTIMAALCGIFEALCIRTFIAARRARAAREANVG
jgi:uncharacterized membrane protein HdeD (DUF308 family)